MIDSSHLLTIPHPLKRILPILTLYEEIFKEEKSYDSDVTNPISFLVHRTGKT